ncbi:MAG: molybdopterin molybdotransferase MoeA [Pirellulaceae bacterium]|nr:molybdopterin molybdotransferase MoeA [Pirellulaceae bacterium]
MNTDPTPAELLAQVDRYLADRLQATRANLTVESLPLSSLVGRIVASDVHSAIDLPRFRRAMMDGVAIHFQQGYAGKHRWSVVADGNETAPSSLPLALPINTGGRVPDSLDTVLPRECFVAVSASDSGCEGSTIIEMADSETIRSGQHVARVGEDVELGQRLMSKGRVIRSQDLGLLSACGIVQAEVFRRPRVAVALTGDEVVMPGSTLASDQVFDANGPVLEALLRRDGAELVSLEYLADDPIALQKFLSGRDADVLVLCGGTSVGPKDFAAATLRSGGALAFHGLPLRPGRPVGMGEIGAATVFLLPGNPIACQFTYDLFVGPLLRGLAGQKTDWPYSHETVQLSEPVASQIGRLDYLRIARVDKASSLDRPLASRSCESTGEARPVLVRPLTSGRASNLTSVSEADGFVLIPIEADGLKPEDRVMCYWYDK